MEMLEVVVDTSVLVGLIDSQDSWHDAGVALQDALKAVQTRLVYFDCVVVETVSVLARRAKERKRTPQLSDLLSQLSSQVPQESITWISAEIRRLYREIMDLVRDTSGELNFHDVLIALGCRELGIKWIATFDSDFDKITWLKRLSDPKAVVHLYR